MADPNTIPPEPHRPEIPGGRYRPSLRVETQYHPAIERRRELNARLLARTCPYGEDAVAPVQALELDVPLHVEDELPGALGELADERRHEDLAASGRHGYA